MKTIISFLVSVFVLSPFAWGKEKKSQELKLVPSGGFSETKQDLRPQNAPSRICAVGEVVYINASGKASCSQTQYDRSQPVETHKLYDGDKVGPNERPFFKNNGG